MPAKLINVAMSSNIDRRQLTDPGFNKPSQLDLLLDTNIYENILINGFKNAADVASRSFITSEELEKNSRELWEIEEPATKLELANLEAEKHYSSHTQRKLNGECFYPPHHEVVTENSSTTKLRVFLSTIIINVFYSDTTQIDESTIID